MSHQWCSVENRLFLSWPSCLPSASIKGSYTFSVACLIVLKKQPPTSLLETSTPDSALTLLTASDVFYRGSMLRTWCSHFICSYALMLLALQSLDFATCMYMVWCTLLLLLDASPSKQSVPSITYLLLHVSTPNNAAWFWCMLKTIPPHLMPMGPQLCVATCMQHIALKHSRQPCLTYAQIMSYDHWKVDAMLVSTTKRQLFVHV